MPIDRIIKNNKYKLGGVLVPVRDLQLKKEWKARFDDYKKSGLSVNAWCRKAGLKSAKFRYWIKRFSTPEENPSSKTQFAEVLLQSNSTTDRVEKTSCEEKEEILKSNTTKQVQTHSSEFQVFIDNIRVIVPGDFNPAALA